MTQGFLPFLRKEISESVRTFRLLILAAVMAGFGILGSLMIRYLPAIFDFLLTEEMMGGVDLLSVMPAPVPLSGWVDFIGSISQIGIITAVVLFAGSISGEIGKNTLIPLLSRGLSRPSVVCAKFISNALVWTVSFAAAAGVAWASIAVLLSGEAVRNLWPALLCLWLYGLFMSAAALFASALCKNLIGAMLVSAGIWAVTMIVAMFPTTERWNPLTLASCGITILAGRGTLGHYLPAIIIAAACIIAFAVAAGLVFWKKRV